MLKKKLTLRLFTKLSAIALASCLSFNAYAQEGGHDQLVDKVNKALRDAGIKNGYVQRDEKEKLKLAGTFKNHDEFLLALMILQLSADFDQINPTFDSRVAKVQATNIELCFPYVVRGIECPYGRFTVKKYAKPKDIQREKFALVIGVEKFSDMKIAPLVGAYEDALAFESYLRERGYKTTLLTNENATIDRVKKEIERLSGLIGDGDELVVFAASHGAPVDDNGEVGIVLYDSTSEKKGKKCGETILGDKTVDAANKMCAIVRNSLSVKANIIDILRDRKINLVVILDTCYSGDALRSYLDFKHPLTVATTEYYEERLKKAPNLGIIATAASGNRMSWGGSFAGLFRERLLSISGGSPRYVGSSNAPGKGVNHGVFTAFILEGLQKQRDSLVNAYEMVKDDINRVSAEMCKTEAGGRAIVRVDTLEACPKDGQNPQLFRVNLNDYIFSESPKKRR